MAIYEVLDDGTIVPKAGKTVGNLDCLRTEVVYDMYSSNVNLNKNKTTGIFSGSWSVFAIDPKYSGIRVYACLANKHSVFDCDLSLLKNGTVSEVTATGIAKNQNTSGNNSYMLYGCNITVDSSFNFTVREIFAYNGIANAYSSYTSSDTTYFVYKVEGILKTPSMIYTGKELFAGNGISIKDGVINANKQIKLLWENPNPTANYSTGTINLNSSDYDFLIFVTLGYKDNRRDPVFARKGESVRAFWIDNTGYYNTSGDSILRVYRDINYINDTTYTVNGCQARNWMSQSSAANRTGFNDVLIPQYVLGVKL